MKLTGVAFGHSGYERALGELRLVQSYVNANDFRRAWIAFNKIEYRYQQERLFQEAKLHITKELGDSLYLGSLATSITSFRDDEKLRISRSFQFYQHARQMREAAITLDSLEALVGASPVIDRMRSGLN